MGHALRGTQDCRASWGPCVAWGSITLQGLRGGIHCGPTDTSSLKLQGEVGGWRWLSGVRRCGSRKTYSHLTSLALSPPVRRGTACGPEQSGPHIASLNPCFVCQYQLLHCIRRPCSRSCPPSNTNIAHVCRHWEPQEPGPHTLASLRAPGKIPTSDPSARFPHHGVV